MIRRMETEFSTSQLSGTPRCPFCDVRNMTQSDSVGKTSAYYTGSIKGVAPYSSILAWEVPWAAEPARLQSMGSQRVRHNLVTKPPP